jgi:hypothetical protein
VIPIASHESITASITDNFEYRKVAKLGLSSSMRFHKYQRNAFFNVPGRAYAADRM